MRISAYQSGAHVQTTGPALVPWQFVASSGIVGQADCKLRAAAVVVAATVSVDPDIERDDLKPEVKAVDKQQELAAAVESRNSVLLLLPLLQSLRDHGHDLDESPPFVYPHQTSSMDPTTRYC